MCTVHSLPWLNLLFLLHLLGVHNFIFYTKLSYLHKFTPSSPDFKQRDSLYGNQNTQLHSV